jgi:hypothetical protein
MAASQEVVWTALQNAAVYTWAADHARYGVGCDPLSIESEVTVDGTVVSECRACSCGAVFGRDGSVLMSWSEARPRSWRW